MSVLKYEIVLHPSKVKKCYGCGSDFIEKYRNPPFNLVVKQVERRIRRRNEQTGQLIFNQDYSNTFYHPVTAHIQRKNSVFTGLTFIAGDLYSALNRTQREVLDSFNLNIVVKSLCLKLWRIGRQS